MLDVCMLYFWDSILATNPFSVVYMYTGKLEFGMGFGIWIWNLRTSKP